MLTKVQTLVQLWLSYIALNMHLCKECIFNWWHMDVDWVQWWLTVSPPPELKWLLQLLSPNKESSVTCMSPITYTRSAWGAFSVAHLLLLLWKPSVQHSFLRGLVPSFCCDCSSLSTSSSGFLQWPPSSSLLCCWCSQLWCQWARHSFRSPWPPVTPWQHVSLLP